MGRASAFARLPTEQRHPRTAALDRLTVPQLLLLMTREDAAVVRAVLRQHAQIARAIRLAADRLRHGGRLYFLGAGTSGRLGVLEAAECPPTFHTPPSLVQALIAGGRRAVFRSREGTEDRADNARSLVSRRVRCGDVVVGITASGVTPFVDAGLRAAARRRAATILITCHPRTAMPVDVRILLAIGPELLTGSTRLKAGTATKLVLNMLTLGAMVQCGKTYGNLMVDVKPTSRKLSARAIRIIQTIARCSPQAAAHALDASRGRTKVAALMAARGLTARAATLRLARHRDRLGAALEA